MCLRADSNLPHIPAAVALYSWSANAFFRAPTATNRRLYIVRSEYSDLSIMAHIKLLRRMERPIALRRRAIRRLRRLRKISCL